MDWLEILKYIAAIASGLAAAIVIHKDDSSRYSACEIHQAGCQGEELGRRSGEGYEADGNCRD